MTTKTLILFQQKTKSPKRQPRNPTQNYSPSVHKFTQEQKELVKSQKSIPYSPHLKNYCIQIRGILDGRQKVNRRTASPFFPAGKNRGTDKIRFRVSVMSRIHDAVSFRRMPVGLQKILVGDIFNWICAVQIYFILRVILPKASGILYEKWYFLYYWIYLMNFIN